MKNTEKNQMNEYRGLRKGGLKKRLSVFLALFIVFSMLAGQLAFMNGAEADGIYALDAERGGEDITIHFGDREDQDVHIHVNPVTGEEETDALDGQGSETDGETGLKEVAAGDFVTISSADGSLLPEEAEGSAEILSGRAENKAVEKVEEVASVEAASETADPVVSIAQDGKKEEPAGAKTAPEAEPAVEAAAESVEKAEYQVFDISLENVDENQYQDGFKVEVALPEDIKGKDFKLYHIHEGEEPVEIPIKTVGTVDRETGLEVVTGFEFQTDGFSEFVLKYIVEYQWEVNGETWRIIANYGPETGIPADAVLTVNEILDESELYNEYVAKTEDALGMVEGSAGYAKLFDIKIVDKDDHSIKYQPAEGTAVDVRIELEDAAKKSELSVVHFADGEEEGSIVETDTKASRSGQTVSFEADSFSVYVIVNHEGDKEIITPRVEFHFIDSNYEEIEDSDTGTLSYKANAYEFVNKHIEKPGVTEPDYQRTQILQDGEGLEKISNPANIVIDNADGTTAEKYFYGWYIVDGSGTESIAYQWTKEPFNVPFETPISVAYDDSTDPSSVKWTLNGKEFVYEADELGCAHVYLAPLYEDYYFVSFHMDSYHAEGELKNSLLTRKLVVFGSDREAEVRIGNVMCPSPDARHLVFVGWQEAEAGTDYYATVDEDGNEVNSDGSSDGYYITVEKTPGESSYAYDLYPVFVEARWIYYNTGMSGNGASYVGAQYRLTNDEGRGNSLTSLPVPTRAGYEFKGWYTEQDSESNGTGTQLTDGTGAFVEEVKGKTFNGDTEKAYEITSDGELYFYRGLSQDGLMVYARWEPQTVDYTIVYWLQNADDDDYTLMHYQTQQGVAGTQTQAVEISQNSEVYTDNKLRFCHLSEDQDPDLNGEQTGIQQEAIEGDGSTIVHVYYDRDVYTLRFDIGFARPNGTNATLTYAQMSAAEASGYSGTVYGKVNGDYVILTPDGNGGYTYPGKVTTRHGYDGYRYKVTTGNETPQYGVVNGNAVDLERTVSSIYKWQYYRDRWRDAGGNTALYTKSGNSYTNSGFTTSSSFTTDPGSNTYYIYNNNGYRQAKTNGVSSTVTTFTYNNGTNYGNGTRYLRVNNEDSNTSYTLGMINGSMQTMSHDAQGWYYNTQDSATISYTDTLYRQEMSGTWQYSVSHTTSSNYGANDNWDTFLTQVRYDLGTTNPFSPSEYTGTYTKTEGGTPYIIFYYDLTAKYGENIMDRYPGSQPVRKNGSNSYSFVGWLGQRDSYYNARLNTSIKGYFETMSEDLILTGGTIPAYNSKINNVNPDSYVAVTVDEDNTITHEHGITQEFRCRYTTLSGAKKYLYRIYLADPDTREYSSEPTDKFVITAGSGSNPELQTPPTYSGYTMVDKKVLSANGTEQTPGGSYSEYDIPELTAAGVGKGMIMQFKFMPNEHSISYMYGSGSDTPNVLVDPENEFDTYYYAQSLANADIYSQTAIANTPEGHTFAGWYDNLDGLGEPFNFNTTMPDGDIVLYAVYQPLKYRVQIDPNGAEIDHIDHTGAAYSGYYHGTPYEVQPFNRDAIEGERSADSGYNSSQATYINADYGEPISEYVVSRNYVPISDAVAETYEGQIYYYINMQYQTTDGSGLPSGLRNALYVTEEELQGYYQFYHDWLQTNLSLMPDTYQGTEMLSFEAWKQLYVSDQKYRKCNSKENYIFLGWYKDDEKMPYNFEDPVEEPFTLTAKWRLDGGYTIQYHADYVTGEGVKISGTKPSWVDPEPGAAILSYADGADTSITKQPDNITVDGELVEDDSYIFRGWRLVALRTDSSGKTEYVPLEDGVYYDPDDDFIVQAAYADAESVIHMQAVYEKRAGSYRRPEIANLTLDANTGYLSMDGSSELQENIDLSDTWTGIVGTVAATVTTEDGDVEIIEFGDIQSNEEVHLYKYATESGVISDDGKNYFVHPDGHFLLGFDNDSNECDYIATYPSDAVISVQRTDEETIYAVWEPMVYITFKNETGAGDVTISLSSLDPDALQVVNRVDGPYSRSALSDLENITVPEGKSITLAIPQGAEKDITVSGTNTLGTGNVLTWSSAVTLDGVLHKDEEYSHTAGGNTHSHELASGQVDNNRPFEFDETLITDRTGLVVTFESKPNDYTIVLDDNYEGGGTQEYNFEAEEVLTGDGDPKTTHLPNTSTRIGYELLGWAFEPDAATPDYSTTNGWTIDNLEEFFRNAETTESGTKVETLYAVWKASADAHIVKVYKEVPLPGSQDQEFTFTVNLTGTFKPDGSNTRYSLSSGAGSSKTFTIKHGGYLMITDSNHIGDSGTKAYVQAVVQVFDENGVKDTDQGQTVRWEHSSKGKGSYEGSERVNVTETPANYYATKVTRASQTEEHSLKLGDNSNITDVPYTIAGNTVSFDTDAGGTVIYTNTRETKDIAVEKELFSNTGTAARFGFSASYQLDGVTKNLGTFYVSSGSTNTEALKEIPAGAELTITEAKDDNYATTVQVGSEEQPVGKRTTFTVTDDVTVKFSNTLKSYPVRIVKANQNGTAGAVEAFFNLAAETGSLGTNLHPYSGNEGLIYRTDALYVGTYTLTETWTESGYIGLSAPVSIHVTGEGVACDDENVVVTGDAESGYVVTVYNVETKSVTVTKTLDDPLISQRSFDFTVSYTYSPAWLSETDGSAVTETDTFTLVPTASRPASRTVRIPAGANVTVTENVNGLGGVYDTTVAVNGEAAEKTASSTVEDLEADTTFAFANTRKKAAITIKKVLNDPTAPSNKPFPFTMTLLNGSTPIPGYTVYEKEGNTLTTDEAGQVAFHLTHEGEQKLTVPCGARLVVSEAAEDYAVAVNASPDPAGTLSDSTYTFTVPEVDTEIVFTNSRQIDITLLKQWYAVPNTAPVQVQLYDTYDGQQGGATLYGTYTLDSTGSWSKEVKVPAYENVNGTAKQLKYYVVETGIVTDSSGQTETVVSPVDLGLQASRYKAVQKNGTLPDQTENGFNSMSANAENEKLSDSGTLVVGNRVQCRQFDVYKKWYGLNSGYGWQDLTSNINHLYITGELYRVVSYHDGTEAKTENQKVAEVKYSNSGEIICTSSTGENISGEAESSWLLKFQNTGVGNDGLPQMPVKGLWTVDGKVYPADYTYYFRETKLEEKTDENTLLDVTDRWFSAYKDEGARTNLFNYKKTDLTIQKKWLPDNSSGTGIQAVYFTVTDSTNDNIGQLAYNNPELYGLASENVEKITLGSSDYYVVKMAPGAAGWTGEEAIVIAGLTSSRPPVKETGELIADSWPEVKYKVTEVAYKDADEIIHAISELCRPLYQSQIRNYGNGAWRNDGTTPPEVQLGFPGDTKVRVSNTMGFDVDVTILKTGSDTTQGLAGAKFQLYGSNYYKSDGVTVNTEAEPVKTGLISGADGKIPLGLLDEGTYYLVETEAPAGYIQLSKPVKIVVNLASTLTKTVGEGTEARTYPLYVTYDYYLESGKEANLSVNYGGITVQEEGNQYSYTLTVPNKSGVSLPGTGGSGTRLIYLLGLMLTALAGVGIVMRRRRREAA